MRPRRTTVSKENLKLIGVPKNFISKTIKDFDDYNNKNLSNLKKFMTDYLKNIEKAFKENVGLMLYGSNGVGKTFLASLIVKEAYICRYTARRTTFVEYITEYTRVWNSKSVEEREDLEEHFFNRFKAVDFLVLEEVGKEIDTKIAIPVLEDCLRYREDKGLVTIICTNLAPDDLFEKYGKSVESLVKGNMTPIKIVGVDRRE